LLMCTKLGIIAQKPLNFLLIVAHSRQLIKPEKIN
jgi:hypothetical protein